MKHLGKTIRGYDEILNKHFVKNNYVKIFRKFGDQEANIYGFILKMSKNFLLVQQENEFLLNGYSIIKKDEFDSLRSSKFEAARKKILIAEGVFGDNFGIGPNIRLSNWKSIFTNLKNIDFHVIVEGEKLEEPEFIIGPIKAISNDKVNIQNYDPAGVLEKGSTAIKYKDITTLTFGDRYSMILKKYLKPAKK